MHIYVIKLTITGSDNGLSSERRQAIIWTNARIFLIGPLGTNFSEILIEIPAFSFKNMHLKMSSGTWRPYCLCLNVSKDIHKLVVNDSFVSKTTLNLLIIDLHALNSNWAQPQLI